MVAGPEMPGPEVGRWRLDGVGIDVDLDLRGGPRATLRRGGQSVDVLVLPAPPRASPDASHPVAAGGGRSLEVVVGGWRLEVEVEPAGRAALRAQAQRGRSGPGARPPAEVRAIIPGRVASLAVESGEAVEIGQALLVVEAMKMQNEIRAPRGGILRGVFVAAGQTVEAGALLVVIE
jgi:biotin carboxyl carrier protein